MSDASKRWWPAPTWRLAYSILLGAGAALGVAALDKSERRVAHGFGGHGIVAYGWPETDRKHYSGYCAIISSRVDDPSGNIVVAEGPKDWEDAGARQRNITVAVILTMVAALLPWLWLPLRRFLK